LSPRSRPPRSPSSTQVRLGLHPGRAARRAAGATVTVTNEATSNKRSTVTNSTGFYVFPEIPVGTYSIGVELTGFKKFVKTGVRLSAASQIAVDAELELGSLEETVTVTAGQSFIQTTTAQVARTIETKQIQELTLTTESDLPGVPEASGVRGGTIGTFDPDSVSNGGFQHQRRARRRISRHDRRRRGDTHRIVGIMLGAQDVETVEEVQGPHGELPRRVWTGVGRPDSASSPRAGRSSFEATRSRTIATRRSTRTVGRGTAAEIPRLSNVPIRFSFHQFGVHLGGPIILPGGFNADRSSCSSSGAKSGSGGATRRHRPATVPTAAHATRGFQRAVEPIESVLQRARTINRSAHWPSLSEQRDPIDRISANGLALFNTYPLPTPGFQQGTNNWIGTQPRHSDLRKDTLKIDFVPSSRHRLSAASGTRRGRSTIRSSRRLETCSGPGRVRTRSAPSA